MVCKKCSNFHWHFHLRMVSTTCFVWFNCHFHPGMKLFTNKWASLSWIFWYKMEQGGFLESSLMYFYRCGIDMASLWHGSLLGHNGLLTFMRILLSAFWESILLDFILEYSILLFQYCWQNGIVWSIQLFIEFLQAFTPKSGAWVIVIGFVHPTF